MSSEKTSEQVHSLARGLLVLKTFAGRTEPLSITEIAAETELTQASARRMLLTLVGLGYLRRVGKRYTVAPKVLDLGYAYLSSTPIWNLVQPVLERIAGEFKVSCSASVLEGLDVLYVVRAPYRHVGSVLVTTGTRQPAQVTAMGRVLLSGLSDEALDALISRIAFRPYTDRSITDPAELRRIVEETRRKNYALVDQELEFGLIAIAVPVRNKRGEIVAAMNAATSSWASDPEFLHEKVLPAMFQGAEQVRAGLAS